MPNSSHNLPSYFEGSFVWTNGNARPGLERWRRGAQPAPDAQGVHAGQAAHREEQGPGRGPGALTQVPTFLSLLFPHTKNHPLGHRSLFCAGTWHSCGSGGGGSEIWSKLLLSIICFKVDSETAGPPPAWRYENRQRWSSACFRLPLTAFKHV